MGADAGWLSRSFRRFLVKFLIKDVVLLGASVWSLGESLNFDGAED
jgi:hypothetical protein